MGHYRSGSFVYVLIAALGVLISGCNQAPKETVEQTRAKLDKAREQFEAKKARDKQHATQVYASQKRVAAPTVKKVTNRTMSRQSGSNEIAQQIQDRNAKEQLAAPQGGSFNRTRAAQQRKMSQGNSSRNMGR